ncbi:unnamed protein product [Kluyveromyces dobzhanskii CBS 2104]|uniref:WGS project CCBQ000000000 data, contig MAT n=1 Tax=Kluyveromyces dobzhanskii CBS 2104 TaxID=1427455 RepID=A0A0A8L417_9SACH|nr:unnamed protein product [Kluyveromyces dobzhanskii CBS 2104]
MLNIFLKSPVPRLVRTCRPLCRYSVLQQPMPPDDFMDKLPERLVSQGNGLKPTTAANQLNTLYLHNKLLRNGFTSEQGNIVIDLLLDTLDRDFFKSYNDKFLRKMELENQSHLFNAAETELKYSVQNLRETSLNERTLELMHLDRDLNSFNDQLNELIINLLTKDSKVDFNDRKVENTLLHREINLRLKDCNNKIGTKINGHIKSEIENLRWQTTRSGLLAVLILVFLIMSGVSISKRINAENGKPMEVVLHTVNPEESDLEMLLPDEKQENRDSGSTGNEGNANS